MKIHLRKVEPDEIGHVIDSWARSFAHFNKQAVPPSGMSAWFWHRTHRAGIRDQLNSPRTRVLVAVHPEEPDTIMGWVCWEPPGDHPLSLHYLYVKKIVRRNGVGAALLEAALADQDGRGYRETHRTSMGRTLTQMVIRPPSEGQQDDGSWHSRTRRTQP